MEGNPFAQFIEMLKGVAQEQIRPGFRLGVVKSDSPLTVEIAGLEYRGDELMINDLLTAEIKMQEHPLEEQRPIIHTWKRHLQTGDQVICLPLDRDDARYFILAKAVAV